jgi:hypothetical protein
MFVHKNVGKFRLRLRIYLKLTGYVKSKIKISTMEKNLKEKYQIQVMNMC